MFGIEALDVVIGLIFIYLLFSLFVTIVNEIINTFLNIRGKRLFESVEELLGEEKTRAFYNDPRIKLLMKKDLLPVSSFQKDIGEELSKLRPPGFIPTELFAEVVNSIEGSVDGAIGELNAKIESGKVDLERIYDTAMLAATDVYKRHLRWILLLISFVIAVAFNVDSIRIFTELANNPEKAAAYSEAAANFLALNDSESISLSDSTMAGLKEQLEELNTNYLSESRSLLGLGWETEQPVLSQITPGSILGWLITALALSLGAPFWFDLLGKVVNLKTQIKSSKT